jgi:SAM-dependent methyltransferase
MNNPIAPVFLCSCEDYQNMKNILACPMCHGKLIELGCASCNLVYQRNNGIPSFICREMYPSDEAYAEALRIIDFWGNGWEKRLAESEHKPLFESDREALVKYIEKDIEFNKEIHSVLADIPPGSLKSKVALEIGCGAGAASSILAYSGAKCIAMDITSQAAQAAEYLMHKIDADGIGIQADTRFIPLENSSVDVVFSSGVLHHSPKIAQSIAEIYRVLKPGGKAYIMLYATWSVLFVQMRLMLSMGEKAWETGNRKNPCTTTYTINECRSMFSQFGNVQIRKTGSSLKHIKIIGKYMPVSLDRSLSPYLGPCLNIVAEKPDL